MITIETTCPVAPTLAEVVERLGSVPLERIPSVPAPGTATEADVFRRPGGEKRLYELVDGVLVEPERREVTVYTAPDQFRMLGEADTLDGGDVLPGFSLAIADWFERAGRRVGDE